MCRRLEDPKQGAIHQVDRQGGHYWLYLKKSATGRTATVQEVEPPTFKLEVADTATLDRVYRLFLDRLPKLEGSHHGELEKRGYSSADIEALKFRSWPRTRQELYDIGKSLLKDLGQDALFSTPGFTLIEHNYLYCEHCQKDECQNTLKCRKVTKVGHRLGVAWDTFSGYAIPVRDLYGRIVSIQLRSDEEKSAHRYVTFASPDNNSCGANLALHVPDRKLLGEQDTNEVWITEGVHKAEIASRKLGKLVLGLPSVSAVNLALPVIEELKAIRVVIAFDADARLNPLVAGALRWAAHALAEQNYAVSLATWTLDRGKGIDDVLVGQDKNVINIVEGHDVWKHIAELLRAAGAADDPILNARIVLHDLHQRVVEDPAYAFRKTIIEASARLSANGAEGQTFLDRMKAALPGRYTAWNKEIERAKKQIEKHEKVARAKAAGKLVLVRGDHAELALIVVDQLTTEYDSNSSEKPVRVAKGVPPVATEGTVYYYSRQRGIWVECSQAALSVHVQALAGSSIRGEGQLNVFGSTVSGTISCAEAQCAAPAFFEKSVPGVAFENVFIKADTTGLSECSHSPEHRARYAYDFLYRRESSLPMGFLALLDRAFFGDPDKKQKVALLQEFSGACRFGLATKYQTGLLLYGPLANDGKTTLVACLLAAMPTGSVSNVRPEHMGERFQIAPLAGALLNYVDEVGKKPIDRVEILKDIITAKTTIQAERKGKDPFLFKPIAGHLYLGNHFPVADDQSEGFFRRFQVIGFNNPIPADQVVVGIEDEILKYEKSAIVHWMLKGAERLISNGRYTIPDSSEALKVEWRQKADSVYCFVSEMLTETNPKDKHSKLDDLYATFITWSDATHRQRMSKNSFGSRLRKWRVRTNEGNFYALQLNADLEAQAKEERNQQRADEALAEWDSSAKPVELDAEEEKVTDLAAQRAAQRLMEMN